MSSWGGVDIPKLGHASREQSGRATDPRLELAPRDEAHFQRLDRLVRTLVTAHERLRQQHAELKRALEDREAHIRGLDEEILQLNQSRRDAAKRLDDLISRLDRLDAELGRNDAGPAPSE